MNFWMIENIGVADFRSLRMLGLSNKREDKNKIGQFGTGFKFVLAYLARLNSLPTIFLGEEKITVELIDDEIVFNRNGTLINSSIHKGFGEYDWNKSWFIVRDLISNAKDEGEERIIRTTTVEGTEGYTRIFVPENTVYNDEFKNWETNFVDKTLKYWKKENSEHSKVYKQGVFVREFGKSPFNYNINNLKLSESRTADLWEINCKLRDEFIEVGSVDYYETIMNDPKAYEKEIHCFKLDKANFTKAWRNVYGDKAYLSNNAYQQKKLVNKGYNAITGYHCWYEAIKEIGLTADSILNAEEKQEFDISDRMPEQEIVDFIISINDIFFKKSLPEIVWFENNSNLLGKSMDKKIYLNIDFAGINIEFASTVFEELSHHYSGFADETRMFQSFLIRNGIYPSIKKVLLSYEIKAKQAELNSL
jgi:hypothetical protein